MFGDWNSRTKQLADYVKPDHDIFCELHLDDMYNDLICDEKLFLEASMTITRNNQDKAANGFGYKLINFLQRNRLFILNPTVLNETRPFHIKSDQVTY